ncbi:MAG: transcription antitermination factor NusB [Eubacteriales bacterium]
MNRRNARIGLVRCMYSLEFNSDYSQLSLVLDDLSLGNEAIEYIENTIKDIQTNLAAIDGLIEPNLKKWAMDRLPKVDLAILRVAVYELKYMEDMPTGVSINEAVDIAKEYSTDGSGKFINGVLSGVLKSI